MFILPYIGGRPMHSLKRNDVNDWLELLDKKYGRTVARHRQMAYDFLKRACNLAQEEGVLGKLPFKKGMRPKWKRKPLKPPTSRESAIIMRETKDDRCHIAYALALLTGMRPCEIFGLRWSRIDWGRQVLVVDQAAVAMNGGVELQDHSKTEGSFREVPLMPQLLQALKRRQEKAREEGQQDHELVIPNSFGEPMNRKGFLDKHWKKMLRRLELEERSFYNARHSCATLLLTSGVAMQVTASILGHKDVRTTMTTYAHLMDGNAAAAVDTLSKVIKQSAKQLLHDPPKPLEKPSKTPRKTACRAQK